METNEMTPEKSLQIINEAIIKSRRDFEKNAGKPMIIWGIIVLIFSFITWIVFKSTGNPIWFSLWFGVPVVGWPLTLMLVKKDRHKTTKNFVNQILGETWTIYGIFATVIAVALCFIDAGYIAYSIVILMGFATAMTGAVLKNHWITAAGLLTGIACPIVLLLVQTADLNLMFAPVALIDLIIPGIMMNRKTN